MSVQPIALTLLVLCTTASVARAQVATPFTQSNVPLNNLASEVTYTVDMSTLPLRPNLIVEAVPDASHPDMELRLEVTNCNFDYPNEFARCDQFGPLGLPRISDPAIGAQSVVFKPWSCGALEINSPPYVGKTCSVKVRALGFGSAGAPATFGITIRGETEVPTSTISAEVAPPAQVEDFVPTTTSSFFNEGQNFRWIYDLDDDKVLVTPVLGRCEWSPPGGFQLFMPYTYQYQGNPTFQGLDCCTWQIGSVTGVTGTGQAIFYINTDSSLPANQPGDADLDGIKDLCDNCPSVPNGPLFGTCTSGSRTGSTCLSDQQCINGPCSLAQDDVDRDGDGDACVPEPGMGAMLATGLVALAALERRRRQSQLLIKRKAAHELGCV